MTQQQDVAEIRRYIAKIDSGQPMTEDEVAVAIEALEQYECWAPYFRLVSRRLKDESTRSIKEYTRLARVQNLYLEDSFATAETCANLAAQLRVPFKRLSEEVLPQVIEFEDFATEATILSAVVDQLRDHADAVACLERLCMIYEKKTHNEAQLGKTYERLLAVDPGNVKALRYFKLVFTQNNEWEEVVAVLKTLLTSVTRPQELYRVAQELAAIYLYQLEMADEAVAVIETYCDGTPLDTSTILYDAYHRLHNWQGCLKILRQCLLASDDDKSRAVLHLKIAGLHEQLGALNDALENYQKSSRLWPECLDSAAGIINIGVLRRDWALVQSWLATLGERLVDERLRAQLKQVQIRLQDGLAHGSRTPT